MGNVERIGVPCSFHLMSSDTRWSARVECVKPIAANIGKIAEAVLPLLKWNIPVETSNNCWSGQISDFILMRSYDFDLG